VLLPAVDAHERLREIGFAMLLSERRPIDPDELAAASGFDDVTGLLDQLGKAGWIDRDGERRLTGSAGLSLTDGPHRLHLDETTFRTWCAYDALGIPAALGRDATVETSCGACAQPIVVRMTAGRPDRRGPEQLWLAARGDDLRSQFCAPTVLLCGAAHGQTWAAAQQQAGQLLDLDAAAVKGTADWGSCAAAADRLAQSGSVRLPDG
jgi:alkylmercury lyase